MVAKSFTEFPHFLGLHGSRCVVVILSEHGPNCIMLLLKAQPHHPQELRLYKEVRPIASKAVYQRCRLRKCRGSAQPSKRTCEFIRGQLSFAFHVVLGKDFKELFHLRLHEALPALGQADALNELLHVHLSILFTGGDLIQELSGSVRSDRKSFVPKQSTELSMTNASRPICIESFELCQRLFLPTLSQLCYHLDELVQSQSSGRRLLCNGDAL
mmetsp:Transcript_8100/g.18971  ORF Transcript_8100/g.18971 Transcript_8100/m.18971 type:complete len:214 (+) Transcript_8100:1262-1903(+)